MSVEEMKRNIYYYADIKATDEEAEEILDFYQSNRGADLSAIINDYYYC